MFESKLLKYIDKADHSEKMTPEMIKRIVGGKESLYALSKELGCSYSYLRLIKQGKIYKAQVAEALKELGLESAEIHSHDTKLPSEHKAPTANTPYSKPVSLSKTAIVNALDKAATKLKEKGMKNWLKYEKKIEKDLAYELKSDNSKNSWLHATENARRIYQKYLKEALNKVASKVSYKGESITLTYDTTHTTFDTKNSNTDYRSQTDHFTFIARVPISLSIEGKNLKELVSEGTNHRLLSSFTSTIKVSQYGEPSANLDKHELHSTIGSHTSGAQSVFKTPLITKDAIAELVKKYEDEIYKIYRSNDDYDSNSAYDLTSVTKGDFTLATASTKKANGKTSHHGDTYSEKHRSGKEVREWDTFIEIALLCRGTNLAQIKNAIEMKFKETIQYGYAKEVSHDGVASLSRVSFKKASNLEQTLLKAVKAKGYLM